MTARRPRGGSSLSVKRGGVSAGESEAERYMRLALQEAEKGVGRTSPNPAVGAILVKNGRIIARGHHAKAGGPHAEVVALQAAGAEAAGADLYVTLEPCDHYGRTPPCSRAVLAAKVKRVFFGSRDPNPLVDGRGATRLRRGGITVIPDVLRDACDALNVPWLHYITHRRPFVTLKVASTLDGKIATRTGDSRWVTGAEARSQVHALRDRVDAVLVGSGTARSDDPALTARIPGGRDPLRVVLDTRLQLPEKLRLFRQSSAAPTLIAHLGEPGGREARPGVELLRCKARAGRIDLGDLLAKLAQRGVVHLLVEGGAEVFGSFLSQGLADRLLLFLAPKLVGGDGLSWLGVAGRGIGRMADAIALSQLEVSQVGCDLMVSATPTRRVAKRSREE